jgi:predicted metal-dependent peptidase
MKNRGKIDDTLAAMFSNVTYREDYLYYAHMIGQCSIKIDTTLPACAGVSFQHDHYNLYINPDMYDELPLLHRLGVLKHEMLHILYGHHDRLEHRVHLPWNFAADCALNQQIKKAHLPDWVVNPQTLSLKLEVHVPENKSSEEYYELIKKHAPKELEEGAGGDGNGNGSGEEGEEGSEDSNESGKGSGDGSGKGKKPTKPFDLGTHDTWEKSEGDHDLQKDVTRKMIEKSQEETIKSAGRIPSELNEWLKLHTRKSEVDWKKVLRGITGNKRTSKRSTIMRRDRRFPERSDLRGKTKDRTFNVLLVGDVSGSMSDRAVLQTVGEVKHVCDLTGTDADMIQIDTVAYPPEKLSKKMTLMKRRGNGGTRLYPAIEMAEKHKLDYQVIIVLTDGGLWGDEIKRFRETGKKVIWLIESSGHILDEMNTGRMQAFKLKEPI